MSEQKHTPEPWEWDAGYVGQEYSIPYSEIFVDGGNIIIAEFNDYIPEGRANAQRIVTCVNACEGAPESIQPGAVRAMAESLEEAMRRIDALYGPPGSNNIDRDLLSKMRDALRLYQGSDQ